MLLIIVLELEARYVDVYILDDHISMSISQNKMWTRSEDEQSNNDKKKRVDIGIMDHL